MLSKRKKHTNTHTNLTRWNVKFRDTAIFICAVFLGAERGVENNHSTCPQTRRLVHGDQMLVSSGIVSGIVLLGLSCWDSVSQSQTQKAPFTPGTNTGSKRNWMALNTGVNSVEHAFWSDRANHIHTHDQVVFTVSTLMNPIPQLERIVYCFEKVN